MMFSPRLTARYDRCWRGLWGSLLVVAALACSGTASAQATSWLYVGGGAGVFEGDDEKARPVIQVDSGLGTSAKFPVVVGGFFRVQGYVGDGADVGVLARVASRGYALGDFGFGVDLGVVRRWWGENATLFTGDLVLGAPWGLSCTLGTSLGADDQRAYFASLGIDLARLTVHRHTGLEWFANPMRSPED
jgi:hypothetical protein